MPRDEESNLTAEDFEFHDDDDDDEDGENDQGTSNSARAAAVAAGLVPSRLRSPYHLPASEQLRGVANRIIFSRYYILFYFAMMSLSFTTLVISLIATHNRQCPPVSWHILEVVINVLMVIEVSTRWVAYGKKYPMTPLNVVDLALVLFCTVTLLLVFRNPCGEGTRREEVLDTILLIIRNFVQFLRLFNILRNSGHSILNPPKPMDLSLARSTNFAQDLDLDLDDEEEAERQLSAGLFGGRSLVGVGGGRTGGGGGAYEALPTEAEERAERTGTGVKDNAGREGLSNEDEELWDRL